MCIFYGDCPFNTVDCEETNPQYKCRHRVVGEKVRILFLYWQQETMESGWGLTRAMSADTAKKMLVDGTLDTLFEQAEIVADSDSV